MKFEEAKKEMESMFPNDFIDYGFKVTVPKIIPGTTYQARACVVPIKDGIVGSAVSFEAPTWRGVVDSFKIHLLPKGEGHIEEAPVLPTTNASTPVCPQCKSTDTGYRCCACGTEFGADDD